MNELKLRHSALLAALLDERPHEIIGGADSVDVAERNDHLGKLLLHVRSYVREVMLDTASNCPVGNAIDAEAFCGGLLDLIHDTITGPFMRAEQDVAENMEEVP